MKKFHIMSFDSAQLPEIYKMFNHNEIDGVSDRHKKEQDLVKWLFSKNIFKEKFFSELGINNSTKVAFEITKPIINDLTKWPDIDLLLYNVENIKESIAIEFKKVKYYINEYGTETTNKIQDLENGVIQSSKLLKLGFHQVYLAIISISDTRNLVDYNYTHRNISDEEFQKVYRFPGREKLNEKVGLIFIEISQTTGTTINNTANIIFRVDVCAQKQEQSNFLNDKIRDFVSTLL